jgi:hypothetical protein
MINLTQDAKSVIFKDNAGVVLKSIEKGTYAIAKVENNPIVGLRLSSLKGYGTLFLELGNVTFDGVAPATISDLEQKCRSFFFSVGGSGGGSGSIPTYENEAELLQAKIEELGIFEAILVSTGTIWAYNQTTKIWADTGISANNIGTRVHSLELGLSSETTARQDADSSLGFSKENLSNKSTNVVADKSSDTKYPSVKSVFDWANSVFTTASLVSNQISTALNGYATQAWVSGQGYVSNVISSLGYTPENVANKSTNLTPSNTNYPTVNAVNEALLGKYDKPTGTASQYIDGTGALQTFPTTTEAGALVAEVYNKTGQTIAKGSIVYINGGHGNLPTIALAIATSDITSAQTFGWAKSDIPDQSSGFLVVAGKLTDYDTAGLGVGAQLYLSGTNAGGFTTTKPIAPIHLVYVGIVVRDHNTQGIVEVKIQNGYELDEIHDVNPNLSITALNDTDKFIVKDNTSVWKSLDWLTIKNYIGSLYQPILSSGNNIKTVNGQSILGGGDLTLSSQASWGSITGDISLQTDLTSKINSLNSAASTNQRFLYQHQLTGINIVINSSSNAFNNLTDNFFASVTPNRNINFVNVPNSYFTYDSANQILKMNASIVNQYIKFIVSLRVSYNGGQGAEFAFVLGRPTLSQNNDTTNIIEMIKSTQGQNAQSTQVIKQGFNINTRMFATTNGTDNFQTEGFKIGFFNYSTSTPITITAAQLTIESLN